MTKTAIKLGLILLCALLVSQNCNKKPDRILPKYLDIIFTSDMFGEVDPCGCKDHAGGLARRTTFIKQLHSEVADSGALLLVDAGSLADTQVDPWDTSKTELALKILAQIGYHAINLGITDLFLNRSFWLRNMSDLLISGNVLDSSSNSKFLKTSKIVELNNLRIGIIGIIDPKLKSLLPVGTGFDIGEVTNLVNSEINTISDKVDLIVLLAHADITTCKQWGYNFPEVDVIIGGHDRKHLFEPEIIEVKTKEDKSKQIPVCFAGPQAKSPGNLRLFINPNKIVVDSFKYTLVLMDETYSKDVWVDSVLAVSKWQNYQRYHEHAKKPLPDPNTAFVGNSACQDCHPTQYRQWSKTGHATSMETLKNTNDPYNLECLRCHVTGWDYETGFVGHAETPTLTSVGCEECHGPARLHLDKPHTHKLNMKFDENSCIQCHNKEWSIDFKFHDYLNKVKH